MITAQIISTVLIAAGWYCTFLPYNLAIELDRRWSPYSDAMSRTLAGTAFTLLTFIGAACAVVAVWTAFSWWLFGTLIVIASAYVIAYRWTVAGTSAVIRRSGDDRFAWLNHVAWLCIGSALGLAAGKGLGALINAVVR